MTSHNATCWLIFNTLDNENVFIKLDIDNILIYVTRLLCRNHIFKILTTYLMLNINLTSNSFMRVLVIQYGVSG